jgi:hypothetical protein
LLVKEAKMNGLQGWVSSERSISVLISLFTQIRDRQTDSRHLGTFHRRQWHHDAYHETPPERNLCQI